MSHNLFDRIFGESSRLRNWRLFCSLKMGDQAVEQAATNYAKLLYTNPDDNRALSFEWSHEWLNDLGMDELNPATLFEISYGWKLDHLYLTRFLSKVRVAKG